MRDWAFAYLSNIDGQCKDQRGICPKTLCTYGCNGAILSSLNIDTKVCTAHKQWKGRNVWARTLIPFWAYSNKCEIAAVGKSLLLEHHSGVYTMPMIWMETEHGKRQNLVKRGISMHSKWAKKRNMEVWEGVLAKKSEHCTWTRKKTVGMRESYVASRSKD